MSLIRSTLKKIVPRSWRATWNSYKLAKLIPTFPDRQYMTNEILPAFKDLNPGAVLFIGTESYTRDYGEWFKNSSCEYWTIDIRPEARLWGAKGKHITGNAIELDTYFKAGTFDIVFLNGVIGWGIDEVADQEKTFAAIHTVFKPDGILLLGWNDDKTADPLQLEALNTRFAHGLGTQLPARKTFPGSTHVYDFLRLR